jgi:hypothetical protein
MTNINPRKPITKTRVTGINEENNEENSVLNNLENGVNKDSISIRNELRMVEMRFITERKKVRVDGIHSRVGPFAWVGQSARVVQSACVNQSARIGSPVAFA